MRDVLGGAKAIVPSTKKVGGPGARLDVPVTHINASYVRSHFDTIEVGVTRLGLTRRDPYQVWDRTCDDDVRACLAYARRLVGHERVHLAVGPSGS